MPVKLQRLDELFPASRHILPVCTAGLQLKKMLAKALLTCQVAEEERRCQLVGIACLRRLWVLAAPRCPTLATAKHDADCSSCQPAIWLLIQVKRESGRQLQPNTALLLAGRCLCQKARMTGVRAARRVWVVSSGALQLPLAGLAYLLAAIYVRDSNMSIMT